MIKIKCPENITAETLQAIRDDGIWDIADEIERLQTCERRLLALSAWIERTHPGDFKSGLWDTIDAA